MMANRLVLPLLAVTLLGGCVSVRATVASTAPHSQDGLLQHVVLLKFTDDATPDQVRAIERRFFALKDEIGVIKRIEGGADVSTEGLAQGFTHCFIVTFADEDDRDLYIPHPAHQAFVDFMRPNLDKVLVVDFQSGR